MDGRYNGIILIKRIEKWSIQVYTLLTVGNHEDELAIPELHDSCPSLISSHIKDKKVIRFGVPPPSCL